MCAHVGFQNRRTISKLSIYFKIVDLFLFLFVVFLLFIFFFLLWMISIVEHGLDVTTDQGHKDWSSETGWNQIEQSWLGMLVKVHDADGEGQASDVGKERCVEVEVRVPVQGPIVAE